VTTREHLSKHDREIAKILEIMGRFAKGMLQLHSDLRELAAAQKRTDAALKAYLESRRATNAYTKRKVDLQ
jgi:hypothetical protein